MVNIKIIMIYKHLFGPVPSRRLGISLGVDLVPFKVCTLDCIYCEVGKTTIKTLERKEYVIYDEIISELNHYFADNPQLDYITFSGAGEPTLNSRIGDVIKNIKEKYSNYKLCLITNGTLFYDEQVRKEVLDVDLILPSLDAVSDIIFRKINRPNKNLSVDKIVEGLVLLRKEFSKQIWLEIFFVEGLNDTDEEVNLLVEKVKLINPDRVQLNTLDRPGTERWVQPLCEEKLKRIANKFSPFPVDILTRKQTNVYKNKIPEDVEEIILSTIKRRPCTAEDISQMLGMKIMEVNKYLAIFEEQNIIEKQNEKNGVFYKIK
ncbi:MAG: radical SAM protein [Ignavibacteriales bacterium]|nr:radical SAM protein [Ignavibacteriales bacterium]